MLPRSSSIAELVGRESELAVLRASLDQACTGMGGVALLAGEPGIGKTRLAEELAAEARLRGARVLWGRCYEGEGAPPFWPWIQIIRAYTREQDPSALRSELGPGAADLARIVPEPREVLPELSEPRPVETAAARFRLFESVTTFLKAAATARQPLVLVLDDLHWADAPSLLLLQFLAGELRAARLLVLGTYRDLEVGCNHPLTHTLAELTRSTVSQRVHLRGLGETEVARFVELIAEREAPRTVVAAVAQRTEGNPFFVTEVVRLLVAEGRLDRPETITPTSLGIPQSIRDVIGRRLASLSERCCGVLSIAAVIGREFGLAPLRMASRLSTEELFDALEEAETARVVAALSPIPGSYAFSHALIRDLLYDDLPTARRLRLHQLVGEALAAHYEADADAHLTELAHHFVQAAPTGDVARAVDYARLAGNRAMALLAYEEAVSHYESALQVAELQGAPDARRHCELLLALGNALRKQGEPERATETFRRAAELARKIATPDLLVDAALGFEDTVHSTGLSRARFGGLSVRLLEEARNDLGDRDGVVRFKVLAALARAYVFAGSASQGTELSQQAVELARRSGDPEALVSALDARRIAIWGPANLEERLAVVTEIADLAERVGDKEKALDGRLWRQHALVEKGDVWGAEAEIAEYARIAEELRQPLYRCYVPLLRASLALLKGQFAEAERFGEEALVLGRRAQSQNAAMIHAAQLLVLRREQGRIDEVADIFRGYVEQLPGAKTFQSALALIYAALDRRDEAKQMFESLAENEFGDLARSPSWFLINLAFLSEVCAVLDDAPRAAVLYRLLLPYAGQCILGASAGPCWGSAARYLGLLATTRRSWDEASGHYEVALQTNALLGARPWLAHSQHDYARALLARGTTKDRKRAAELLARTLEMARELRMARLTEQVSALVGSLGQPPGSAATRDRSWSGRSIESPTVAYPDDLSEREVEVLRRLAGGQSNREIAEELILSVRTVEHHVANVYAKIGARGRADAAAYAVAQGLTPVRRQSE